MRERSTLFANLRRCDKTRRGPRRTLRLQGKALGSSLRAAPRACDFSLRRVQPPPSLLLALPSDAADGGTRTFLRRLLSGCSAAAAA